MDDDGALVDCVAPPVINYLFKIGANCKQKSPKAISFISHKYLYTYVTLMLLTMVNYVEDYSYVYNMYLFSTVERLLHIYKK